mgnify:FL=1
MSSQLIRGWFKLPGEPEKTVKGGTTVSGGNTVLSAMAQQSFNTQRRPYKQHKVYSTPIKTS